MAQDNVISRHKVFALGGFFVAWLEVAPALAGCPVVLQPPDAEAAWKAAALEAEKRLAEERDVPQDCRSVVIEVQREGNALLTFTTVDGRSGARLLHAPEDIAPTLEALLVTLPLPPPLASPPPPPPAPGANSETASPDRGTAAAGAKPPEASAAPPPAPRFVAGASLGGRWGIDEMIFAPAILLRGSFVLSSWELGVRGEWNPTYSRLFGEDPAGFRMYSLAASLTMGRREKLRRLDIPYGISMGLAGVHEDIDADPNVRGDIGLDTFEPLVGAYLGFAAPRNETIRFSLGLALDAALSGLKTSAAVLRGLPALPRFGVGLSIGMEVWP